MAEAAEGVAGECPYQQAWQICDPHAKLKATLALPEPKHPPLRAALGLEPGRPEHPRLISPRQVPRRGLGSVEGRIGLLHAVAHIEFNAINLALDALIRFGPDMPLSFSRDWWSVAVDEARHFQMLEQRLQCLGAGYGDLPAHNGLWEAAQKTAHDVLARMALVPRVLEARGLDVTPPMMARLAQVGAQEEVAILDVILREEVRHVAIGSRWYAHLCTQRKLPRLQTFHALVAKYLPGFQSPGPFNHQARAEAGFQRAEYEGLAQLTDSFS
nr:ferritin-like domain-containing protein [Oceanococcus sp. HetDA_MAG_MS8]